MTRLLLLATLLMTMLVGVSAKDTPIWHTGSEGPVYSYDIAIGEPRMYYDKGGPEGDIVPNYSLTIVQLRPFNSDSHITVVFDEMEIGAHDQMRFYNGSIVLWNGPDESGEYYYDWPKDHEPIYTVKGTPSNPKFSVSSTSADGALTIGFTNYTKAKGWKATVYCVKNGDPEPGGNAPKVVYVKEGASGDGSSWATATGDLQAAIDGASSGTEIWVAAGTYKPSRLIKSSKNRSHAFILKEGVSIYGGFAGTENARDERKRSTDRGNNYTHKTILSADDDVPDVWTRQQSPGSQVREEWTVSGNKGNSNHLLYSTTPFTTKTTFEGLTLKGANSDVWNVYCGGGALYASGNVELRNCTITEHYAYTNVESYGDWKYFGGGVTILKGGDQALVADCDFSKCMVSMPNGTAAGGGVYIEHGSVERCTFEGCIAFDRGGAIYAKDARVLNCQIQGSYAASGGGLYADHATISGTTISDSKSLRGGGIFAVGATIQTNTIYNCYADDPIYTDPAFANRGGGAIWCEDNAKLVGNLIYNCSAFRGGGVFAKGAGDFVYNTIVNCTSVDKSIASEGLYKTETMTPVNSIYEGENMTVNFAKPTSFAGTTTDAAQLQELTNADWHLLTTSPLVGTAVASDYDTLSDIYGEQRVVDGKRNPGAIALAVEPKEATANIELTFASTTEQVTIGTGGYGGTSFEIDYGDGERHTYEGAKNVSFVPQGSVKIYGKDIVLLLIQDQGLTSIKFGENPVLQKLQLSQNQLKSINLSSLPALKGLYLEHNAIEGALDLSAQTKLNVVSISDNKISGVLDLTRFSDLTRVECYSNQIEEILLPSAPSLTYLDGSMNRLSKIDVSMLAGLTELLLEENNLTSLDVQANTVLEKLYCPVNKLTTLDLSANKSLKTLTAFKNGISTIDLSHNSALEGLYLQSNALTTIDLSTNKNLKWVNLSDNKLPAIDLTALNSITLLNVEGNALSALDVTTHPSLNTLHMGRNQISSIDLSNQKSMYWLTCGYNQLTQLDIKANGYISWLECPGNQLSEMDLSAQKNLQKLFADHNKLTSIDLAGKTGIQGIQLQSNQLPEIVLTKLIGDLPDVSTVELHDNNREWAKQLDLSHNPGSAKTDVAPATAKGWIVKNETPLQPLVTETVHSYFDAISQMLVLDMTAAEVTLYDLNGRRMLQMTQATETIDLSWLPQGAYIATIKHDNQTTELIRIAK